MVLQDQTDEACLIVREMTPRKKNFKKDLVSMSGESSTAGERSVALSELGSF